MIRRPPRSTLFPYRRSSDLPILCAHNCNRLLIAFRFALRSEESIKVFRPMRHIRTVASRLSTQALATDLERVRLNPRHYKILYPPHHPEEIDTAFVYANNAK